MKKVTYTLLIMLSFATFMQSCKKSNPAVTPVDAPASIATITPSLGLVYSVITIKGNNFDLTTTNNVVKFNGVDAVVDSASATQLLVTVPATATTGKITVTVNGKTATSSSNFKIVTGTVSAFNNFAVEHLAVDANGYIYGDDHSAYGGGAGIGNDIVRFSNNMDGVAHVFAGATTAGYQDGMGIAARFKGIWGLAVDAAGNVYVADAGNYRIRKVSATGVVSTFAGSGVAGFADGQGTKAQFYNPIGMAVDASGNIYTCDAHRIRKITPDGLVTTLAGTDTKGNVDGKGNAAQFNLPEGIATDVSGNVFVSDNGNFNVRKIAPNGTVTTVAGNGVAGYANGTGTAAQFIHPQGIAIDAAGTIFVSDNDYLNNKYSIRMINRVGEVRTFMANKSIDNRYPNALINYAVTFPDGIAIDSQGNMFFTNTGITLNSIGSSYISFVMFN